MSDVETESGTVAKIELKNVLVEPVKKKDDGIADEYWTRDGMEKEHGPESEKEHGPESEKEHGPESDNAIEQRIEMGNFLKINNDTLKTHIERATNQMQKRPNNIKKENVWGLPQGALIIKLYTLYKDISEREVGFDLVNNWSHIYAKIQNSNQHGFYTKWRDWAEENVDKIETTITAAEETAPHEGGKKKTRQRKRKRTKKGGRKRTKKGGRRRTKRGGRRRGSKRTKRGGRRRGRKRTMRR